MMGTARMLQRQSLLIFEPLIAAGLLYFAVVVVLTRVMAEVERLERKYNGGQPFPAVGARELPQGRPMGE